MYQNRFILLHEKRDCLKMEIDCFSEFLHNVQDDKLRTDFFTLKQFPYIYGFMVQRAFILQRVPEQ